MILRVTYCMNLSIISWNGPSLPSALYQDPAKQTANKSQMIKLSPFKVLEAVIMGKEKTKKEILRNSAVF